MKAISKILSLALVGVMTLGCATTAFAAEPKADATTEVVSEADNNEFTIVEQEVDLGQVFRHIFSRIFIEFSSFA